MRSPSCAAHPEQEPTVPLVTPRSSSSRIARSRITRRLLLQGSLGAAGVALAGCSAPGIGQDGGDNPFDLVARPAEDVWPQLFLDAPEYVQENYRYAVANQDLLKWMPCFCGCVDMNHDNNFDCYVREVRDDGSVLLDPMSFG